MEIKTGYLYHIKDEYFDVVNDDSLMQNHEKGKKRPTYFTIKDGDILWFIPISSKVEKYQMIINNKIEKYGFCNTIIIRKIADEDAAILLQNAFPTSEKSSVLFQTQQTKTKKHELYTHSSFQSIKQQNGQSLHLLHYDNVPNQGSPCGLFSLLESRPLCP